MVYQNLIKENVAPYKGRKIGIYDEGGNKVASIQVPKDFFKEKGTRLYRFGVLSDIHHDTTYDQYYYNLGTSQPTDITNSKYTESGNNFSASDFANALHFFEEKDSVEFTCIAGDLVVSSGDKGTATLINNVTGERFTSKSYLTDFDSFKHNIESISPTTPVFCTKGNHDAWSMDDVDQDDLKIEMEERGCSNLDELWNYYVKPKDYQSLPYDFHFFKEGVFSAYYFIKALDNGKKDVFIFVPVISNVAYNDNVISWFENVLEEHKDRRCFVFTHIFMNPDIGFSGNFKRLYHGMSDWYNSNQHKTFVRLFETYKNAIWFHGHSHFVYGLQNDDELEHAKHCNISSFNTESQKETAYSVHVSSCAYPRVVNEDKTSTRFIHPMSQGMVVDVYDDHIETRGITFSYGNRGLNVVQYENVYEPIAHYWIDTI